MKIQKSDVGVILSFLGGADELKLKDARIRDKAIRDLTEYKKVYEVEKTKVYEKFCTKDDDGKPKVERNPMGGVKYNFPTEIIEDLNSEMKILNEETFTYKPNADVVRFIEISNYKPKVGEVEIIDDVLERMKKQVKNLKKKKK